MIAQEGVGEVRERRLTAALTVWLVIALHLFPTVSVSGVFRKLARGLRLFWPDPEVPLPTDSALGYRRRQLGARPLVVLFHQVCHPIATKETRGAFCFGLRLMVIDGTSEDVPYLSSRLTRARTRAEVAPARWMWCRYIVSSSGPAVSLAGYLQAKCGRSTGRG